MVKSSLADILAEHVGPPRSTRADALTDIEAAEKKHRYTDPRTGERVISVTKIANSFDPGDKLGRGAAAAAKITREGGNYREEWDAKRDTGIRVHDYAGLWIEGKTADILAEDMPYMDAFADWCRKVKPEWIETERAVVSSLGYGGRFDAVVYFEGEYWLIDFKTGKPYDIELTLQMAGYRFADGMIVYDDEGNATGLDDMPHIDRCAGLYLGADGLATLKPTKSDETAFAAFRSLLDVTQWTKTLKESK